MLPEEEQRTQARGLHGEWPDEEERWFSKAMAETQQRVTPHPQRTGIDLRFIQPGKPIQNALVESFNGKFRDACLNEHWFIDITDARCSIEAWRVHYNTVRPHSSLGFLSPELFRMAGETSCGKAGRSATLENSSSFPLSHSTHGGDNSPNFSLSTWT